MKLIFGAWQILNAVLAVFFLWLIIEAWIEIFYYRNSEKQYYYLATLFVIPFLACLTAAFGWDLDGETNEKYK